MKTKQQLEVEITELRKKQEALFTKLHELEAFSTQKRRLSSEISEIEAELDDIALELARHYALERLS